MCPVGYKISDRPRTGRRGGGVALIYRDSLSVRRIDAGEKESFEYSEWTISSPSLNLRLVLLYHHLIQLITESQLMISSRS